MARGTWFSAAGLFGLGVGLAVSFACGQTPNLTGHWIGGNETVGSLPVTPDDAGQSFPDAWPVTDPDPDAAPHGGPGFGDGGMSTGSCTGKTGASGEQTFTLQSGGLTRDSILHVPSSYDPTKPAMLIVNFHGYTSNSVEQEVLTRMDDASDAKGFLVAYPDGIANSWNAGDCCGDSWTGGVDDVQFARDLVAYISASYCVDPARIYATGFSNGGFLSHRLACEAADLFAAISPVSGVLGIPPNQCMPSRPVPVLEFHGTADPVVPYAGGTPVSPYNFGTGFPIDFRSVPETIAFWTATDSCFGTGNTIYQQGDATCVEYAECAGGSDVTLCTLNGDGHTWPGGVPIPLGNTSTSISATDTMVSFFEAHPMP